MQKFDAIRPFYDAEVNAALQAVANHPMMNALMNFAYPNVDEEVWKAQLLRTHSIRDFQINFAYQAVQKALEKSSDGLSTSGFETLEPNTSYLFISNHRDIILDTSILNVCLFDHGLVMTASAIGDNLVKKDFLKTLSKLNRNFVVQRGLPPRELLESSKLMSEYIAQLLLRENRSVWIAQREGRTKDGNDATHSGVLKMLAMGSDEKNVLDYFKKIKIVPVSISYEYDPTDALKKQIQALAQVIDDSILQSYKLWPTNYIAYDLLHHTDTYATEYTEAEKSLFERRLEMRIDGNNEVMREGFLAMYANPVINQLKYRHASQA